jgi:RNA polymerase sigma-70 factor, ECF subfamily
MIEPETEIIEACRQGDRDSFQRLFEAYKDRVYRIALHYSGEEATARDVTQQVFLKLFTAIRQFRGGSEFTTWLYRIVVNACIDERRKRKRFVSLADGFEIIDMPTQNSQEQKYIERQIADSVRAAIAELSPKLRLAILLKYVEDLSYDEIAEAMGCSKGTVASRLNRGHKALANKLGHLRSAISSGDSNV